MTCCYLSDTSPPGGKAVPHQELSFPSSRWVFICHSLGLCFLILPSCFGEGGALKTKPSTPSRPSAYRIFTPTLDRQRIPESHQFCRNLIPLSVNSTNTARLQSGKPPWCLQSSPTFFTSPAPDPNPGKTKLAALLSFPRAELSLILPTSHVFSLEGHGLHGFVSSLWVFSFPPISQGILTIRSVLMNSKINSN